MEFWNCLSSLVICGVGIYDMYLCRYIQARSNELIIGFFIFCIGLGSAAFHGTLRYEYQMWDEVPMIWVVTA